MYQVFMNISIISHKPFNYEIVIPKKSRPEGMCSYKKNFFDI